MLTAKQQLFAEEYLIDLNATQAAIRAGYSTRTAHVIGGENLTKPEIKKHINDKLKARKTRTEIKADYVLNRLVAIDQMDIADIFNNDGRLKPVSAWPEVWRQTVSGMDVSERFDGSGGERDLAGLLKKIKWPDKLRNLELLGKHIEVSAFKENIKHEHKVTTTLADVLRKMDREESTKKIGATDQLPLIER